MAKFDVDFKLFVDLHSTEELNVVNNVCYPWHVILINSIPFLYIDLGRDVFGHYRISLASASSIEFACSLSRDVNGLGLFQICAAWARPFVIDLENCQPCILKPHLEVDEKIQDSVFFQLEWTNLLIWFIFLEDFMFTSEYLCLIYRIVKSSYFNNENINYHWCIVSLLTCHLLRNITCLCLV